MINECGGVVVEGYKVKGECDNVAREDIVGGDIKAVGDGGEG